MSSSVKLARPTKRVGGWIGEIPASWGFAPLKRFCSVTLGKMIPIVGDSDAPSGSPYLRAAHVQPLGRLWLEDIKLMQFSQVEACRLTLTKGDVVVVEGGAGYGRAAFLENDLEGWGFQNSINRVRTSASGHGRYVNYLFSGIQGAGVFETLINTSTIPHLTAEKLEVVAVSWPPLDEQRQIAQYLDRETGKIDELITKQEQLVATLTERRQAVIAQAVTSGLHTDIDVKESGVEWIGIIPAHWIIGQVKNLGSISLGKMIQPEQTQPGQFHAPYMRAANVQPDGVLKLNDVKQMWFNETEHAALDLKAGDVVVVEGGVGGYGRAAFIERDVEGWGYQNSINRVRVARGDGRFLTYMLIAARSLGFIAAICVGVSMPHFTAEKLARFQIPIPPIREQSAIADHLDAVTAKIDSLTLNAGLVIETLRERRAALISAAVTGKIDVRGL